MTAKEYQDLAMRTNDRKGTERLGNAVHYASGIKGSRIDIGGIVNASLGLSGEVGELNDMIKKWIFHEADMDFFHAEKEIGDVLWYVAMMCESMGFSLEEVMQKNVDKLRKRYPEGFDINRSAHREADDI